MRKSEVDKQHEGLPITLIIGSMRGVSRSDLKSYIEGLARSQCHAIESVRYAIHKQKEKGSWIYEIHEGGCVKSIYDVIEKHFADHDGPVRFALSDNRYSEIDVIEGDWVNVIGHATNDMVLINPSGTGGALDTFISTNKGIRSFSLWLFVFSSVLYISLIILTLTSYLLASKGSYYQHMTGEDKGISYQAAVSIEKNIGEFRGQLNAMQKDRPNAYLKKIQYKDDVWSAEFSKDNDNE